MPSGQRYKQLIRLAYCYKKLRYSDFIELYMTGKIRQWDKQKRENSRGFGACNLQGHSGASNGGILHSWFSKDDEGWYRPSTAENTRRRVFSGDIRAFAD